MGQADGMNELAMSEALRRAGYSSSFERLINIARDAWTEIPGRDNGSYGARYRHVRDRLSSELTFVMMRQWQSEALREAINYLLKSADPKNVRGVVGFLSTSGGRSDNDTQSRYAPAISSPDPAQAGGGGPVDNVAQSVDAPAKNDVTSLASHRGEPAGMLSTPRPTLPAAPSMAELSRKMVKRTQENAKALIRLHPLDNIRVLVHGEEKKLRECTAGEVRAWARGQRIHANFAERLVSNCASNVIVGDLWKGKDEEVRKIYAEAEAQYAA